MPTPPSHPITGTITWTADASATQASQPALAEPVRKTGRPGRSAPVNVRLRPSTSERFWQAYLAAKQEDPFLSATDHASALIEAALDAQAT